MRILKKRCHLYRFYKNSNIFSKNLFVFLEKITNFERFENFYYFSRNLRQNCNIWRFSKVWNLFLRETHIFYFYLKNPFLESFGKSYFSIAFYGKLTSFWWKRMQTGEQLMLVRFRELNWQTSDEKTVLFEKKISLSDSYEYGAKKII